MMAQREIDFAWSLVDWRTFDPASPLVTFPGDAQARDPSALELLVITLKKSPSAEVHYACCAAIAYLAVRADVRAAISESGSGPLMETLDLLVRRLEATDHPGLRCAPYPPSAAPEDWALSPQQLRTPQQLSTDAYTARPLSLPPHQAHNQRQLPPRDRPQRKGGQQRAYLAGQR